MEEIWTLKEYISIKMQEEKIGNSQGVTSLLEINSPVCQQMLSFKLPTQMLNWEPRAKFQKYVLLSKMAWRFTLTY